MTCESNAILTDIVGVDESGVGALAGEIFAAAVSLPVTLGRNAAGHLTVDLIAQFQARPGGVRVTDTKRMRRNEIRQSSAVLREWIAHSGGAWGIGSVTVDERILYGDAIATGMAMARGVDALRLKLPEGWRPDKVVVDGERGVPGMSWRQHRLPRADGKVWHVSAAAILASAARTAAMEAASKSRRGWQFNVHLGYGTPDHINLLHRQGTVSDIHIPDICARTLARKIARSR